MYLYNIMRKIWLNVWYKSCQASLVLDINVNSFVIGHCIFEKLSIVLSRLTSASVAFVEIMICTGNRFSELFTIRII